MQNLENFIAQLDFQVDDIRAIIDTPAAYYHCFEIAKQRGGVRKICAPTSPLMMIQRKLLHKVLYKLRVSRCATAYVPGRDQRDNARFHKAQKVLVKIDICDFFGSITERQVTESLEKAGLAHDVAILISEICCLDGILPQGASTSGYISNIVMKSFDRRIIRYCRANGLRYTRYSDDIAVSGEAIDLASLMSCVRVALRFQEMKLNDEKFRVLRSDRHRQIVTGLVVNQTVHPGRIYMRNLRQQMYYVKKFGVANHAARSGFTSAEACVETLLGWVAHARYSITGKTSELDDWKRILIFQRSLVKEIR